MMMRNLLIILAVFLYSFVAFSQEPNDCVNAVTVCGNGNFVSNANGPGNSYELSNCGVAFENNIFWIKINVVQAGTLGFDLIPVSTDMQVDYDFWVFGPNLDCSNLGSPIRCNTNNPTAENAPNNHTGMNGNAQNTTAGPGSTGTPYVKWLNVLPGESYYIAIDRFLGDEGFELQWIGSATQGNGAFAEPPVANEIPDYLTCSNNPNIGLFDLTTVRSDINPDIAGNTFSFYTSYANAIDGINALPTILANSSNPQTIIAKVTNNVTGCFSLTEFDLVVSGIPNVTMSVSETDVCPGENVTVTFSGTPGVTVNYEINGMLQQAILDPLGSFSFIDTPVVDTDYHLVSGQVINSIGEIICSNSGIGDTQSVSVNNIQAPVMTSNGPICEGDDAEITFSGEAGTILHFLLDSTSNTITLGTDGTYQVSVPNVTNTITVELESMEQSTAPFCSQDLTGNTLTVIVNPLPAYEEPMPKVLCDFNNPGDEQELFLLDAAEVIAGENGVTYTFYESYNNAINDIDALEGDSNNPNNEISYYNQTNPQTLYIRGENDATGCFTIMTLDLEVLPIPYASIPTNLTECDESPNDGFASFDLTLVESEILGVQNPANYNITYYLSQAEAELPATPIANPDTYENSVANGETIYARIEIVGDSQCYAITSFSIDVIPSPDAAFQMDATCDGATATILGDTGGTFSFAVAPIDTATIDPLTGTISNATPGTTYEVEYAVTLLGCFSSETVTVTINALPNIITPTNLLECGSISNGVFFDLESKTSEITDNNSTLLVTYYASQALAEVGDPLDALQSPYEAIMPSQTIYVRVQNTSGCVAYTELILEVFETTQVSQLPLQSRCDTNGDGIAEFDLTEAEITIGSNPNWTLSYHTTQVGAENGTGGINTPQAYDSSSTTVYVLVSNTLDTNNLCDVILPLQLVVNPQPVISSQEVLVCEPGTNGFEAFDLQAEIPNILGTSQDPLDFDVAFFEDSLATNEITANPYTNTTANTQTIYVEITNVDTGCWALFPYNLEVQTGIQVATPSALITCDFLDANDGVEIFDLTSVETEILNGQDPNLYSITYHFTENEALNGNTPITNPEAYQNTASPYAQTIYIRVEDLNTVTNCIAVTSLELEVSPLIEPIIYSVDGNNTLCVDYTTDDLLNTLTLACNLQGAEYTYQWYLDGGIIAGATSNNYQVDTVSPGNYSVQVTNTQANLSCNSGVSNEFEVIQSGPPNLVSVATSQPFDNQQTISVQVEGYGHYVYQLNSGAILDNGGVFYNVPSGIHTVTVYDAKTENPSCGFIVINDIEIIGYPKFLTPNGDGYHDTWNIYGMEHTQAEIFIFDRYGKLLKQMSPAGGGWDGTFHGKPLPSNDYWFTIKYKELETGESKEFSSHFTLKR